jgi:dTDP-4-dehydrorhamnose reductase
MCSRFEFAAEVLRLAGRTRVELQPIALADFKRASTVPPYTPLRNMAAAALGVQLRPWQDALAEYVQHLAGPQFAFEIQP